jgi:hypothetical protein
VSSKALITVSLMACGNLRVKVGGDSGKGTVMSIPGLLIALARANSIKAKSRYLPHIWQSNQYIIMLLC